MKAEEPILPSRHPRNYLEPKHKLLRLNTQP